MTNPPERPIFDELTSHFTAHLPVSVAIQTSQNVLLEYEPASIGDRILATLLDYVVFFGWFILVFAVPVGVFKVQPSTFYVVLMVLPVFLYDLLCEWLLNGQNVGKLVLGIRVVMLDGSQPGLGAYLLRWLLRLVDTQLMSGLVAIITIAATGRGQRLGDLAAGTTVVKVGRKVALYEVLNETINENHEVVFPEVSLLTDRDVRVIREALSRGNEEVVLRTADKVKAVIGAQSMLPARRFLELAIADYQFLALKE